MAAMDLSNEVDYKSAVAMNLPCEVDSQSFSRDKISPKGPTNFILRCAVREAPKVRNDPANPPNPASTSLCKIGEHPTDLSNQGSGLFSEDRRRSAQSSRSVFWSFPEDPP